MSNKDNNKISALERQLAALDLSDQSEIKDSLRHELMQKIAADRRGTKTDNQLSWRWNMFRKPLPAMALGIFLGVAILALAHPDTRAALADFIKSIKVGENTYVAQINPLVGTAYDSILAVYDKDIEEGRICTLNNEYGGWGGEVPEGVEPVIKHVSSLSLAGRMVDYPLQVPTYFHESLPARLRFQKAQVFPDGSSILYFGAGPKETMLSHYPVGEGRTATSTSVETYTSPDGTHGITGIEPKLEELEIAGKKVFWQIHDDGRRKNLGRWATSYRHKVIGRFIWEHEGISYTLDGKLLTKEEGIKIIDSLRPMRAKK